MVLETLGAAAILTIAFEAAVAVGCEKAVEGVWDKGKTLWGTIRERFAQEPTVETALATVAESKSPDLLAEEVVPFLQVEMKRDPAFAEMLRGLAQEIRSLKQESGEAITINATSRDNSTQKVVGKIEANEVNF